MDSEQVLPPPPKPQTDTTPDAPTAQVTPPPRAQIDWTPLTDCAEWLIPHILNRAGAWHGRQRVPGSADDFAGSVLDNILMQPSRSDCLLRIARAGRECLGQLNGVIRDACCDEERKYRRLFGREQTIKWQEGDGRLSTPDTVEELVTREADTARNSRIQAAVEALPDELHAVVRLWMEGRSWADIAAVLSIGTGAARNRFARACNRLRRVLSGA